MPPKKTPSPAAAPPQKSPAVTSTSSSQPAKAANKPVGSSQPASVRNAQDTQEVIWAVWENYNSKTPQRTKLLDVFMGFLVVVAVLQFVYVVGVGNYPFNAFLAGFSATVGQFVLTASLRIQTNADNKAEFKELSHERAFADFVFGSMILHFFCVNFIN